jgi:hypothetical protein
MLQQSIFRFLSVRRLIGFGWRRQAVLFWLSIFSLTSYAQGNFVSGSTGADGAFNPTASQTVQLPESGVFNFTTINIPANVVIRFGRNSRNTPVVILATGNVTIAGTIDVSGFTSLSLLGGAGGPGGFNGGAGGQLSGAGGEYSPGVNGDGPGGGSGAGSATTPIARGAGGGGGFGNPGQPGRFPADVVVNGNGGPKYGLPTLLPLIGGSGGGGEVGGNSSPGAGGGGGGGALLLASSGTITFVNGNGNQIAATGGNGNAFQVGSGGGSGGGIRLVANIISGNFQVNASGGGGYYGGSSGGGGYVRIEAFDLTSLTINVNPSLPPRISTATPGVVMPSNSPIIRIVTVAGIAPPNQPNGSLQGGPDIILPANQSNPVSVALSAANIPLGTTLQVTVTPENGARIVTQSTALSGTLAASTATASIAVPDGISVIQASGTIDVAAGGQSLTINGEKVKQIVVTTVYGGDSGVTYITKSNKRIRAVR